MKRLLFSILFAVLASGVWAGPTVTASLGTATVTDLGVSGVSVLTVDWLSSSTGACTATIGDVYGVIQRITIKPDSGATAPTNAYDVTLSDADGFDVLIGHGANVSSSTVTSFASMVEETTSSGCMPVPVMGSLSLAVTNAGDQNGGIIRLYLKP